MKHAILALTFTLFLFSAVPASAQNNPGNVKIPSPAVGGASPSPDVPTQSSPQNNLEGQASTTDGDGPAPGSAILTSCVSVWMFIAITFH